MAQCSGARRGGEGAPGPILTPLSQLAQEARRIYDEFLSSHSVSPVNIDRQAWIGEDMLATPSPDMFRLQQLQVRQSPPPSPVPEPPREPWAGALSGHLLPSQIFNLMKFDSYTRFVKSPLYQACLRAESQGQPLPDLRPHSRSSSPPPDLSKVSGMQRGDTIPSWGRAPSPPCHKPGRGLRTETWRGTEAELSLPAPEVEAEAGEVPASWCGDGRQRGHPQPSPLLPQGRATGTLLGR